VIEQPESDPFATIGVGGISRRRFLLGAVVGGALMTVPGLLEACQSSAATKFSDIFRLGYVGTTLGAINPFTGSIGAKWWYAAMNVMYPQLVSYNFRTNQVVPQLAQSWSPSPDRLTWTFVLKSGRWSDGKPITANDATFTFDKAARVGGLWPLTLGNVKSYRAVDDRTLEMTLKQPDASMPTPFVNTVVLPEHAWSQFVQGKDTVGHGTDNLPLVAGGPFTLSKVTGDNAATFTANTQYFDGAPLTAQLGIRQYGTFDALLLALEHGEIDIIPISVWGAFNPDAAPSSITSLVTPGLDWDVLFVNVSAKAKHRELQDLKVRQAISMGFDRQAIATSAYRGRAHPQGPWLPPAAAPYRDESITAETYSPDMANAILDSAGYRRSSDGIRSVSGQPMHYKLLFNSQVAPQCPQIIKQGLAAIGIAVDIQALDDAAFFGLVGASDFDLAVQDFGYSSDPRGAFSLFGPGRFFTNALGYRSPELDQVLNNLGQAVTTNSAVEAAHAVQQIFFRDKVCIPVVGKDAIAIHRKQVTGLTPDPKGVPSVVNPAAWTKVRVQS
jgi:peptide/nickel transport system substrate-binding protein